MTLKFLALCLTLSFHQSAKAQEHVGAPSLKLEAVRITAMNISGNAMPGPEPHPPLTSSIEFEYQAGCAYVDAKVLLQQIENIQYLSVQIIRDLRVNCAWWDTTVKKATVTTTEINHRLPVLLNNPILIDLHLAE